MLSFFQYVRDKVFEEEETCAIVYSVREDLMQNVMNECYKRYVDKQCVKFLVHCSYKALVRLIDLNFFVHNPNWPYYNGNPDWAEDYPPEPSPPDTWAAYNVPIEKKAEIIVEEEISQIGSIANLKTPSSESISIKESNLFDYLDYIGQEEELSYNQRSFIVSYPKNLFNK